MTATGWAAVGRWAAARGRDSRQEAMIDQPEAVPAGPPGAVPLEEAARRLGYEKGDWRVAARLFPVRWPSAYLGLAEGPGGEPQRLAVVARDLAEAMALRGWIACSDPDARIRRYRRRRRERAV